METKRKYSGKKWIPGTFKVLKLKVPNKDLKNYQKVLEMKGTTMQQDFQDNINRLIK